MTTLVVPHDPASAAVVRRALVEELAGRGVPAEVVDDAALVLSELLGNAVRHGSALPDGGVRAGWWVVEGAVHLEVCDGGPGPGELPAAAPSAEGGRGLPIVDAVSRRWGTTAPSPRGVVGVWAELPLPGAPPVLLSRGGEARVPRWSARVRVPQPV